MAKKPLKATDRRRNVRKAHRADTDSQSTGVGTPLADLWNNRSRKNGSGKRAS